MLEPGLPAPALDALPVFGAPVHLHALTARQPAVVCFVRHLGSPAARSALGRLQAAMPEYDRRGVALVAVTRSGLGIARDFVPRHHLLFPLICDPEGQHFTAWGVVPPTGAALLTGLLRALPAIAAGWRYGQGVVDAPLTTPQASFAVRRGGALGMCAVGPHLATQPHAQALLEAACSG